jgi:transposase-like protein
MTKRKVFSREFKLEAIRLMESGQKKSSDLARELGVPRNRLYKWREQLQRDGKETAFPGKGRQAGEAGEIAKLQREIDRLREENDILKKAARYFAKESA